MSPFDPIGPRARWRVLYDLTLTKEIGDVITYEEMGALLALDPVADRHVIQMAFRRAAKEYEQKDDRAVDAVQNVGYRVVTPGEHLRLAKTHQKKSGRSLQRGHSKVVHVDLNGLAPDVRHAFDVTASALAVLLDFNRRLDARVERVEAALEGMTVQTGRTDQEVEELKARLARLEARSNPPA